MTNDVTLNQEKSRYEITVDGELAGFAEFAERDDVRDFNHTEIFPDYQGRGLSGELIQYALDDTHDDEKGIKATCSAVQHFIDKNPGYERLIR